MFFGTQAKTKMTTATSWESGSYGPWSLIFTASNRAEEEKTSLEMDTHIHYLIVDSVQWTVYGGVTECELSDDRLILRLTEREAEKLRTPAEMGFGLALD
jgi:hypothetical protein